LEGEALVGKHLTAEQAVYWDGKSEMGVSVSSGTYFYQLKADDYAETHKWAILNSCGLYILL